MTLERRTRLKPVSAKRAATEGRVYSTLTSSRKPINPRNAKRQASEFVRTYHSAARKAFIKALPCVACGRGPCDNAHIAGEGASRKAGYEYVIPLCRRCHRLQHDIGAGTFTIRFSLNLRELAAATERAWQSHLGRSNA